MFTRKSYTFDISDKVITNILNDPANPLNRIITIISDGSSVLDIGAGNGLLGKLLKTKHDSINIDGIEPDKYAAYLASPIYRKFYNGMAEEFIEQIACEDYDYIVLADVLEHMADPLTFLRNISNIISDRTKFIFSIPNIAFGSVRMSLLNGQFDYVDSGLLERTHLRFFTLKTIETLVSMAGLHIEQLNFLERDFMTTETKITKKISDIPALLNIYRDRLSSTYQFLVVATKTEVKTKKETFGKKTRNPILSYFDFRTELKSSINHILGLHR